MPQLDLATFPSQVFWLFISFGILCVLMSLVYLPRLGTAVEARARKLQEDHRLAEALKQEMQSLTQENHAHLHHGHVQTVEIIRHTLDKLSHLKTQRLRDIDNHLSSQVKHLQSTLHDQKQEIHQTLEGMILDISLLIAPRIISIPITTEKLKESIEVILKKRMIN